MPLFPLSAYLTTRKRLFKIFRINTIQYLTKSNMRRHSKNPQASLRSVTRRIMILRRSSRHAHHRSKNCRVWLRVRRETLRIVGTVGKIIKGSTPSNPPLVVWDRSYLAESNKFLLIKGSIHLKLSRPCLPLEWFNTKPIQCSNPWGGRSNIRGMAWVPMWPYFPPRGPLTWQGRSDLTVRSLPMVGPRPPRQISKNDRKLNLCHVRRLRTQVTYQRWCPKPKLSKLHPS